MEVEVGGEVGQLLEYNETRLNPGLAVGKVSSELECSAKQQNE